MRNLKKFLALVLAMMMVFSLMVTVNASNFADASDITDKYATAVDVLYQLGILKGGNDGNYYPGDTLTRAQFAAILYRIHSGDAEEKYVAQYKSSATKFSDVSASDWFAGQLGYAIDKNLLIGGNDGNYWPDGPVTSAQVVIGMLRALGYDAKKELQGPDAGTQAVITGNNAGILATVGPYNINDTPATREMIAQLAFDTLMNGQIVNYRESTGGYYDGNGNTLGDQTNAGPTLGKVKYDLRQITDASGNVPGKQTGPAAGSKDKAIFDKATEADPFGRPTSQEVWTARNDTIVFTVGSASLVKTFTSAMSEAEIFAAVGAAGIANGNKSNYYIVMDEIYQNGASTVATAEEIGSTGQWQAVSGSDGTITDTVIIAKNDNNNTIGFGNGVTAELYDNSAAKGANHYKLVLINEYLGYVTAVNNGIITIETLPTGGSAVGTIEAAGFKVGDAVLYTFDGTDVQSAVAPKTVSGTVSRIVRSDRLGGAQYDTYRINGVEYKLSQESTAAAMSVSTTPGEWYLDSHGYIIGDVAPAEDPAATVHYGYLLGYQANKDGAGSGFLLDSSGGAATEVGERFWFIDENGDQQKLDGAYKTNATTGAVTRFVASDLTAGGKNSISFGSANGSDPNEITNEAAAAGWTSWTNAQNPGTKGILFGYTLNEDGKIDFVTTKTTPAAVTTNKAVAKVTKGTAMIEVSDTDPTDGLVDANVFGTDKTVYFFIELSDTGAVADWAVHVGYGKVPTKMSEEADGTNATYGWIQETVNTKDYVNAMYMIVDSVDGSNGTDSYVYFAGVSGTEIIKELLSDGKTMTYTYTNVYVDGVKSQITVKVTSANKSALDAITAGQMFVVTIGDDGYSTIVTDGGTLLTGTKKVERIESGYYVNEDHNWTYFDASKTAFYQVDPTNKTVTKVSKLPDVTEGYDLTILFTDVAQASSSYENPVKVVYFSFTKS